VRLLEEVIYLVEVDGVVAVDVRVQVRPDGGLRGRLGVARLQPAMVIGPAPKAVAWHQLSFPRADPAGGAGSRWTCGADGGGSAFDDPDRAQPGDAAGQPRLLTGGNHLVDVLVGGREMS
jgi:hypothetical protein